MRSLIAFLLLCGIAHAELIAEMSIPAYPNGSGQNFLIGNWSPNHVWTGDGLGTFQAAPDVVLDFSQKWHDNTGTMSYNGDIFDVNQFWAQQYEPPGGKGDPGGLYISDGVFLTPHVDSFTDYVFTSMEMVVASVGQHASIYGDRILQGDYNQDGTVDAADYSVWKDQNEQTVPVCSGADVMCHGYVDEFYGYGRWVQHFGLALPTEGGNEYTTLTASVPEPASLLFTVVGIVAIAVSNRRKRLDSDDSVDTSHSEH